MSLDMTTQLPLSIPLAELDAAGVAAWASGDRGTAAGLALVALAKERGACTVTAQRIAEALEAALAVLSA